jgi:hypothetical protein
MSEREIATTAYTLRRGHTCAKCEHSNVPCPDEDYRAARDAATIKSLQQTCDRLTKQLNECIKSRLNRP